MFKGPHLRDSRGLLSASQLLDTDRGGSPPWVNLLKCGGRHGAAVHPLH